MMIHGKSVAFLMTLVLLGAMLAPAPAAEGTADGPANAALAYWSGFAAQPLLDEQQQRIVDEWNTATLDDAARNVIEASKVSLSALQWGAKAQNCDWGLRYEDGPDMLMPHLGRARMVSRLAGLRARYEFEQGNYRAGVDDVIATLVLARRCGADFPLISLLVQYAMERPLTEMTANYLTKMDAASLKHLAASLDTLPPGGSLQRSLLGEKQWMISWLSTALKEGNESNWKDTFMKFAGVEDKEGQAVVQATLQAAGPLTPLWKAKLLEDLGSHYDALLNLLVLPQDQFMAQSPALHTRIKTANPVAGLCVPVLDRVYERDLQARTHMALFRAAIAIALEGPDKMKDFQDAAGKAPFEYRAFRKGFELKSRVKIKDQPVMLMVGESKKD
jgi:hypothetical protein